jgi:hypothetical protein
MNRTFTTPFAVMGTLAADWAVEFVLPFDCQLIHASVSTSNTNNGTIKLGTSADDDAYLTVQDLPDNDQDEYDRDDFVGTQFPHIAAGTVIAITVDHDGDSGTAAADLAVVLTFTEG